MGKQSNMCFELFQQNNSNLFHNLLVSSVLEFGLPLVKVTGLVGNKAFIVQTVRCLRNAARIQQRANRSAANGTNRRFEVKEVCLALHDGNWWRARIKQVIAKGYLVNLIDHSNLLRVSVDAQK